ncbi:thiol-disulfide oxidoreductase DCC family protein [Paraconexibacter sp.]|uniref:thiol-disulfide oxidoreductase DCC family protein n=1 Tax=Paraconexibacter sp. TaxID=2949640 RepID=UPI003568908A
MPDPDLTVLYDADCGFCRWSVAWLLRHARDGAVAALAIQSSEGRAVLHAAGVPPDRALRSAHAIPAGAEPGALRSGGDAGPMVAAVLRGPLGRAAAMVIRAAPAPLRRAGYSQLAAHRVAAGRLVSARRRAAADAVLARHGR